jgi:hypothetical protein
MYNKNMRTTIELKPEHRAKLLELAARRGEKGFSSVIGEAIEAYLTGAGESERVRARALRLRGTMTNAEADRLRHKTGALRALWR